MTIKLYITTLPVGAIDRACLVRYYYTKGCPATVDSPEECPDVEIDGVYCGERNITQLISDSDMERIIKEIYEYHGSFEIGGSSIYE